MIYAHHRNYVEVRASNRWITRCNPCEVRMSSDNRFSHPGKVQSGDIYEVFRTLDEPVLSTSDINREIDWASRSTVHRQLVEMRNANELRSKKAGDQSNAGEVWYAPDEIEEIPQPTPDIIKLIYRNIYFSLVTGGLVIIGFGFILFLPGYFGEGQYLGLVNRNLLVLISLVLYVLGILMVSGGSVGVIKNMVAPMIRDYR